MALRSLRLTKVQNSCQCFISNIGQGFVSETKYLAAETRKKRHYSTGPKLITTIDEAKRFMKDCLKAVGTPAVHAEIVANNLIEADHRGFFSHGMNRLEMYIRDIQHGTTDVNVEPVIVKETVATALVDGKNGLGAVIGKRCMEIAINKAKDVGIGFVVAKGSNHYGIAGIYGSQAIDEGLLGLSFSNTSPFMTPTRAKQCALGTNPLTLGAPGLKGDSFLLDMATTTVAVGKIEIAKRKQEPIPEGWAVNNEGIPETNPTIAYNCAKLMPLGGTEENSGYKGYGLGMLVEIFCGILSGSTYGPHIRPWGRSSEVANLGQSFIAIDPNAFEPGFSKRLSDFMTYLRNMESCALGTNPLTLGAPGLKGDSFLLDMATTTVAVGKIEIAKRKQEPIPEGWAVNNEGIPETNPTIAYNCAKLMPLGGTEENSGYKGYGLGMLVEIFCGILSGSTYGPHIRPWGRSSEVANLGQSFIAIDPNAFEPGFSKRLSDFMTYLRNMESVNPEKPVLVHGDKEKVHIAQVNQEGGLEYVENQHKTNFQLAEELKVKPMVSKSQAGL